MSRVHTWKASSQVKARLTSNSIFITFLEDAQLKTFLKESPHQLHLPIQPKSSSKMSPPENPSLQLFL